MVLKVMAPSLIKNNALQLLFTKLRKKKIKVNNSYDKLIVKSVHYFRCDLDSSYSNRIYHLDFVLLL